jgi:DNA-binding beta-propeller fold protein YncE
VTALAGNGEQGDADGVGAAASLYFPCELAVAPNGDIFATDEHNSIIRKITQTGIVTTLAGRAGTVGVDDGMGPEASFRHPQGIAVDRQGMIYVADTDNHMIRRITPLGRVTTLAGLATVRGHRDGKGKEALLDAPASMAVDSRGVLYVTNGQNNLIRKISPAGVVSTLDVHKWIPKVDIDSLL